MTGTSRDVGLKSPGAGKGDAPRNVSAAFYQNFDEIDFGPRGFLGQVAEREGRFKRLGNKLRKTYK